MNLPPFISKLNLQCFCLVTPIRVATLSSAKSIKPYDLTKEIRSDVYSELDSSLYGNEYTVERRYNNGLRAFQNVLVLTSSFRYI